MFSKILFLNGDEFFGKFCPKQWTAHKFFLGRATVFFLSVHVFFDINFDFRQKVRFFDENSDFWKVHYKNKNTVNIIPKWLIIEYAEMGKVNNAKIVAITIASSFGVEVV